MLCRLASLCFLGVAFNLLLGIQSLLLAGPSDDLAALTGQALHYYQTGNELAAYPLFSQLIDARHADPRIYYYRGLIAYRRGDIERTKSDFRAGSALEMASPDPHGMTSIQMYRIQGAPRQLLEQYRSEAKIAAYQMRERARWAKFRGMEDIAPVSGGGASSAPGQVPGMNAVPGTTTPARPAIIPDDPFAKPATPAPSTTPTPPPTVPDDPFKKKEN